MWMGAEISDGSVWSRSSSEGRPVQACGFWSQDIAYWTVLSSPLNIAGPSHGADPRQCVKHYDKMFVDVWVWHPPGGILYYCVLYLRPR